MGLLTYSPLWTGLTVALRRAAVTGTDSFDGGNPGRRPCAGRYRAGSLTSCGPGNIASPAARATRRRTARRGRARDRRRLNVRYPRAPFGAGDKPFLDTVYVVKSD
ncbi:hypothetical protein GCM10022244_57890 [Streptomyces gulbargensis]|uniref:Uncharacterized protein n=1 Tax=Streptomyces gulbargensis TaxID=364901 RepID=A0ABP7NDY6_9ACTN